jgi:hypothetical protein
MCFFQKSSNDNYFSPLPRALNLFLKGPGLLRRLAISMVTLGGFELQFSLSKFLGLQNIF